LTKDLHWNAACGYELTETSFHLSNTVAGLVIGRTPHFGRDVPGRQKLLATHAGGDDYTSR